MSSRFDTPNTLRTLEGHCGYLAESNSQLSRFNAVRPYLIARVCMYLRNEGEAKPLEVNSLSAEVVNDPSNFDSLG